MKLEQMRVELKKEKVARYKRILKSYLKTQKELTGYDWIRYEREEIQWIKTQIVIAESALAIEEMELEIKKGEAK